MPSCSILQSLFESESIRSYPNPSGPIRINPVISCQPNNELEVYQTTKSKSKSKTKKKESLASGIKSFEQDTFYSNSSSSDVEHQPSHLTKLKFPLLLPASYYRLSTIDSTLPPLSSPHFILYPQNQRTFEAKESGTKEQRQVDHDDE